LLNSLPGQIVGGIAGGPVAAAATGVAAISRLPLGYGPSSIDLFGFAVPAVNTGFANAGSQIGNAGDDFAGIFNQGTGYDGANVANRDY